jgi:hypothetical protein
MPAKFEIDEDARGEYWFRLKAGNGEIVAVLPAACADGHRQCGGPERWPAVRSPPRLLDTAGIHRPASGACSRTTPVVAVVQSPESDPVVPSAFSVTRVVSSTS